MKIIDERTFKDNLKLLTLDEDITVHHYNAYSIDGEIYEPVAVYDAKRAIGLRADKSLLGKTVEFVRV